MVSVYSTPVLNSFLNSTAVQLEKHQSTGDHHRHLSVTVTEDSHSPKCTTGQSLVHQRVDPHTVRKCYWPPLKGTMPPKCPCTSVTGVQVPDATGRGC